MASPLQQTEIAAPISGRTGNQFKSRAIVLDASDAIPPDPQADEGSGEREILESERRCFVSEADGNQNSIAVDQR